MTEERIEIRQAGVDDLDLLMEWRMKVLHEVFAIPADQPVQALEQENRTYYLSSLENDSHIACLTYIDDTIVGCGGLCLYREMPSPDNPSGQCAYLMNIFTSPEFRGRGIGRKIVTWLVNQATSRNITKIYLEASEVAKSLYEEVGFHEMPDMMKL